MNLKSVLLRNIVTNWGVFGFNLAIVFLTTPLIIRALGKEQYGVWIVIVSLGNYYFLMNAGLVGALKRNVPQLLVDKDWEGINIQATTAMFFLLGVSLVGLAVTGLVVWLLPYAFLDESVSVTLLRGALFIAGIDFSLWLLSLSFLGLLYGAQRFDLASYSQILGGIVRTGLIFILLPQFPNILTLAWIIILSNQITNICAIWLTFRVFPVLTLKRRFYRRHVLRESLSFGIFGLMSDIASRITSTAYPILIGSFLAITNVSYFAIAESLVSYVTRILGSVSGVLMPTVSALERQNQLIAIRNLIINTTRYLAAIALLAFLNFLFAGYQFLDLWLSQEFAEHSWGLLVVLSISVIFTYPHAVALNALSGLGFPDIVNNIAWIDAIGIVVGFFVVIPFGGIFEISLAYCVARSIVFLYFIPKNICEKISMKPFSYLLSAYAKPALISLPTALVFMVSHRYFPIDGWVPLIFTCVTVSTLFCVFAWFFVIERSDQISVLEELNSISGLVSSAFWDAKPVESHPESLGKDAD